MKLRGDKDCKQRRSQNEWEPPACDNTEAPAWLTGTARDVWDELVPAMEQAGVLRLVDRREFARYCELTQVYLAAAAVVAEHGQTMETSTGDRKARPELNTMIRLSAELHKLASAFGLNPCNRSKVLADPKKAAKGIERFIKSAS